MIFIIFLSEPQVPDAYISIKVGFQLLQNGAKPFFKRKKELGQTKYDTITVSLKLKSSNKCIEGGWWKFNYILAFHSLGSYKSQLW